MLIGLGHRPDLELRVSQPRVHAEVPVGTRRGENVALSAWLCLRDCSKPDPAHRAASSC